MASQATWRRDLSRHTPLSRLRTWRMQQQKIKIAWIFRLVFSKSCLFDVLVLSLLTSIYQDVGTWDLSNHRARDLTWEKASSKGSKFGNGWKRNHGSSSITEGHHGNQVALGLMLLEKLNFSAAMFWNPLGRPILMQWCTNNERVALSMIIIYVIQKKAGISNLWLDTVDGPKIPLPSWYILQEVCYQMQRVCNTIQEVCIVYSLLCVCNTIFATSL